MPHSIVPIQTQKWIKSRFSWLILGPTLVVLALGLFWFGSLGRAQEGENEPAVSVEDLESIDDVFGRIATQVPSFGGMYEEDGKVYINLTIDSPTQKQAATDAVAIEFGFDVVSDKTIVTREVQYGYNQLREWYKPFVDVAFSTEGVTGTEIDEKNNKLKVGIETSDQQPTVEHVLANLNIPSDVIEIIVTGPVELLGTLNDVQRPLVGGLYVTTDQVGCTLGPTSIRSNVIGFVTNSHCTGTMGQNNTTPFYQGGVRIGTEAIDPTFFTGGACPSGRGCRYSDSAFINKNSTSMTVGRIAKPDPNDHSQPINWNGSDTYRIVGERRYSTLNQIATKVGARTGQSSATIVASCWNADLGDYVLLCQDGARMQADHGDSGSPVFQITNSPSTNDALLLGILWGMYPLDPTVIMYSPIGRNNVKRASELGGFITAATSINPLRRNWDHFYVWRGGSQSTNKAVWWSANQFIASFNEVKTVQFNSGGSSSGFADTAYVKFCSSLNSQGEPINCFGERFVSNINDYGTTTITYSTPIQFTPGQKYWFSVNSGSGSQKILLYYSNFGSTDYTEGCNKWQDGTLHYSCSVDLNGTLEAWPT